MKRSPLLFFTLILLASVTSAQNASYNANTVPVGGTYSTAFGVYALRVNTGASNTATGYTSMYNNSSGANNTATGRTSMYANTTGSYNSAHGYYALFGNTTGSYNTAAGAYALLANSTGTYNAAFGYQALYNNNGSSNTAIGYQALYYNTGNGNTANGYLTLYNNTSGEQNLASGTYTLHANTTGNNNVAVGSNALAANITGSSNVSVGVNSMITANSGGFNTACGYQAIAYGQLGSYNTGIGSSTNISDNVYNSTCIGYQATSGANNRVVLGNTSVTSIGGQVGWTIYSDARVKQNFKEDVPGLSFISLLKPVTYNYNVAKENELLGIKNDNGSWEGKNDIEKIKFSGFVAQDVDAAARKVGYDFSGLDKSGKIMGLRYADFVVPLVKAIQEQQAQIDELKNIIASGPVTGSTMELSDRDAVALSQNSPNPFTKQTVISFSIPVNAASAQFVFYDAAGRLISTHNITDRGRGLLTISANELSSGVYSYTLVVNGKIEGTKQLIKQ